MTARWFRFYEEALNEPRVQSLDGELFKFWVNILCVTSQCDGVLPSHCDVAFFLRMNIEQVAANMKALIQIGLIDETDHLIPHNWDKRQYKSDTSAERTRKYREKIKQKNEGFGDVSVTSHVTPPETETETDNNKLKTNPDGLVKSSPKIKKSKTPDCPYDEIFDLYERVLVEEPKNNPRFRRPIAQHINSRNDERKKKLQKRWAESLSHQTLEFWEAIFCVIRDTKYYNGTMPPTNGYTEPFKPDIEFILGGKFSKLVDRLPRGD